MAIKKHRGSSNFSYLKFTTMHNTLEVCLYHLSLRLPYVLPYMNNEIVNSFNVYEMNIKINYQTDLLKYFIIIHRQRPSKTVSVILHKVTERLNLVEIHLLKLLLTKKLQTLLVHKALQKTKTKLLKKLR